MADHDHSAAIQTSGTGCTKEAWTNKWTEGATGWHQSEVHPRLIKYHDQLTDNKKNLRIFVPLCGKTVDMKWLADQGHTVVGLDLAQMAAEQFFKEHNLKYKMDAINIAPDGALVFKSIDGKITIFVCDLLNFESSIAGGKFDGIWDRASLVAMNPSDRKKYSELMVELLTPSGRILGEYVEYDANQFPGPPFHIPKYIVEELFGDNFKVQHLEKFDGVHLQPFGLSEFWFCMYLMTKQM